MATLPPRRCSAHGCAALVAAPAHRCPLHPPAPAPDRGEYHRANGHFYSSARWRKFRMWILGRRPLCSGWPDPCTAPATLVDHITPIEDGGEQLDPENCQPLCASCHGKKTIDDLRQRSAQREGGGKTYSRNDHLPLVKLKKCVRGFRGKGVTDSAISGVSGADALKAAKNRLLGRVAYSEQGGTGASVVDEKEAFNG
jgi:hypothetical protein